MGLGIFLTMMTVNIIAVDHELNVAVVIRYHLSIIDRLLVGYHRRVHRHCGEILEAA